MEHYIHVVLGYTLVSLSRCGELSERREGPSSFVCSRGHFGPCSLYHEGRRVQELGYCSRDGLSATVMLLLLLL